MHFTTHEPFTMILTMEDNKPTEIAYVFSFTLLLSDKYLAILENVKEKTFKILYINEEAIESFDGLSIQTLLNKIQSVIKDNKLDLSQLPENIRALFLFS